MIFLSGFPQDLLQGLLQRLAGGIKRALCSEHLTGGGSATVLRFGPDLSGTLTPVKEGFRGAGTLMPS
jgi:hypothetical protein